MRKQRNPKYELAWNLLTTISGNTLAQMIPIAVMPLLTIFYSPSAFGTFSLYVALATICSVAATGRYELAIMLPRAEKDAANIAGLSIIVSAFMSLFFLGLLYCLHHWLVSLLGNKDIAYWLYTIPVFIFLTGVFQVFTYWSNRQKRFSRTILGKLTQGSTTAFLQLGMGLKKMAGFGLIAGYILGLMVAVLLFAKTIWQSDKEQLKQISKQDMLIQLKKYQKFPLYSLWGAMLDSAALQMPIILLSTFYSAETTGLFSLTFRALNLPLALIAVSVSQVLFQKITALNNEQPELLFSYILKSFFVLAALALPFVLIIHYWGPQLFTLIFGTVWTSAGEYASVVVFGTALRFAVSPLSTVLAIEHNLKSGFYWQMIYFCTLSTTLFLAAQHPIHVFLIAFVIHEIVLYLLYFYLILQGTRRYSPKKVTEPILANNKV